MPEFANWAGTARCSPSAVARPATEAEVRAVVADARTRGIRCKPFGGGHSWSDVACTSGLQVATDGLVGPIAVDRERMEVTVPGGVRLRDLLDGLAAEGLALPIVGSIDRQTVAGAIATGTHGSSLQHGNLASGVRGLRWVDGRGQIVEERDPGRLDAIRVGLGAFGIVTSVTLAVEPAFRLEERIETIPIDDAIAQIGEISRSAEYVKLWWLPHTASAIVFRYGRSAEMERFSERGRALDERFVNRWVFAALLGLARRIPAIVPVMNRVVAMTYLSPRKVVGRSDRVLTLAMPPVHREAEESVPVAMAGAGLAACREAVEAAAARVDFITEVRFVRGDAGWASPAHGGDRCAVGAYSSGPDTDRYFAAAVDRLRRLGGRPHWGKESNTIGRDDAMRLYPQWAEFCGLAREMDPDGIFRNAFLDRVLG